MKKFLLKLGILVLPLLLLEMYTLYFDTFNVFHWKNIRFTSAQPNENFVKTQYVIHNTQKFNAFILGSSRVGNIPPDCLPNEADGTPLRWYNMTYSEGIPAEHLETLRTFLKNGVEIDMVLLGFDNIAMYASIEQHERQLLRMPFQVYEKSPLSFYMPYLLDTPSSSIVRQIVRYNAAEKQSNTELYYGYGVFMVNTDFSLTENPQMKRYVSNHSGARFTQRDAFKDIGAIAALCQENGIRLVLFTNPLYETTYRDAAECGYFDFLRTVADIADFYNFSSLNAYTANPQYYSESSHYRPALGLLVEKMLFGTEAERARIRQKAGDDLWGVRVSAENVEEIVAHLQARIANGE